MQLQEGREYANAIGKQLGVDYNLFPGNHLSLQNDRTLPT